MLDWCWILPNHIVASDGQAARLAPGGVGRSGSGVRRGKRTSALLLVAHRGQMVGHVAAKDVREEIDDGGMNRRVVGEDVRAAQRDRQAAGASAPVLSRARPIAQLHSQRNSVRRAPAVELRGQQSRNLRRLHRVEVVSEIELLDQVYKSA